MPYLFAIAIIVSTNLLWFLHCRMMQKNAIQMAKLLASRTLSEYHWLEQADKPKVEQPKEPGYDSIWEDEENDLQGVPQRQANEKVQRSVR